MMTPSNKACRMLYAYILVAISGFVFANTAQARSVPPMIAQIINNDACVVSHLQIVDLVTPTQEDLLKRHWRKEKEELSYFFNKALADRKHVFMACEYKNKDVIISQFFLVDLDNIRMLWFYTGSEFSTLQGGFRTHQVRFLKSKDMGKDAYANIEVLQTTLPAKDDVPYMPGPPLTLLFTYQDGTGYEQYN